MRYAVLLTLPIVLGACVPLSIYYKPGASVSRLERDTTQCQVDALSKAPVASQIRQEPPTYVPERKICDAAGNCTIRPGFWKDGQIYTVDVNQGLRGRVEEQCMADRGYQPVSIPACPSSVSQAVPAAATRTLPQLSPSSCAIRNRDGSWQIVNRG